MFGLPLPGFRGKVCSLLKSLVQPLTSTVDVRVYEQGELSDTVDSNVAFCQLAKPNRLHPTYVIGLEPPFLLRGKPFRIPQQLYSVVTPQLEQRTIFNITPKYSFVDLHIGKLELFPIALCCSLNGCRLWYGWTIRTATRL